MRVRFVGGPRHGQAEWVANVEAAQAFVVLLAAPHRGAGATRTVTHRYAYMDTARDGAALMLYVGVEEA